MAFYERAEKILAGTGNYRFTFIRDSGGFWRRFGIDTIYLFNFLK